MSTEFEELLCAGMDRFTATAPVPAGLARKAARRRRRRRTAICGAAVTAAAGAAAVAVGIATVGVTGGAGVTGGGSATAARPATTFGPAANAAQLVAYATRAASAQAPFNPGPDQWIYTEILQANSSAGGGGFLFGPPNERQTTQSWMRADRLEHASLDNGKVVVTDDVPNPATVPAARVQFYRKMLEKGGIGGWPTTSYPYLDSLPSDPAQLEAIIGANVKSESQLVGTGDEAIFDAIDNLIQSTVLPPRLYAGLYGVLTRLPGVHFDEAADLAGRSGQGLYMVQDGYLKMEIVINPKTYAYMGYEDVAVRAHASDATDGPRQIRKGQVLGWQALLASGIVDRPGQLP